MTTATTSTTLPCSSYLTEQSTYANGVGDVVDDGFFDIELVPQDWLVNFGRSPECRSYAAEYRKGVYTISGCGDQNTVIRKNVHMPYAYYQVPPAQIPPTLVRRFSPLDPATLCCGNCSLNLSQVRLYYFPDSNTPNCQYNQTSNSSSIPLYHTLEKGVRSFINDASIAVSSGYTL